jgi:DNA-binding NarL/FixJ family response regulator
MLPSADLPTTTILLIDGHADDRTYYADRLKHALPDCDILEASSGKSGLALHGSRALDCIVVELALPDMSAFEVLLSVVPLMRRQTVAFVMLSRVTLPSIAELARQYGAQSVLIKRFTSGDELAQAVTRAIALVAPNLKDEERRKSEPPMYEL